MRALLCLSLALIACGGATRDDSAVSDTATRTVASTFRGPDPLFLRVPRAGGPARVVAFPNVDSTIWTSSEPSPAPGRVLGFDDDAGVIAMLDARSRPMLVDLRRGTIDDTLRQAVTAPVSLDGSTVYGVTAKGDVVRRSQSDVWRYTGKRPARGVFPLRDGSVLIWSGGDAHSTLARVKPPSTDIVDSLTMPAADLATGTGVGDRLYFASGEQLQAVQTRTLALSEPIPIGGPIADIAVTPSGDRIYVLATIAKQATLVSVDRYRWRIASTLSLDGKPRELRVDPLGRYVLVRGARDTVTVISLAANRVVGTMRSEWRTDLPLVAPDNSIAVVRGGDVLFLDADDQRQINRVQGGASELWFAFWWTGFRPRAVALDQPVTFDSAAIPIDSAVILGGTPDTLRPPASPDTLQPRPPGFTVSFFTLLSESRAQTEAASIQVGGETAHVETVVRNGVPMYRVILGPYATCADAQRVARASRKTTAWIPEGGCDVPPPVDEPLAR